MDAYQLEKKRQLIFISDFIIQEALVADSYQA